MTSKMLYELIKKNIPIGARGWHIAKDLGVEVKNIFDLLDNPLDNSFIIHRGQHSAHVFDLDNLEHIIYYDTQYSYTNHAIAVGIASYLAWLHCAETLSPCFANLGGTMILIPEQHIRLFKNGHFGLVELEYLSNKYEVPKSCVDAYGRFLLKGGALE